MAQLRIGSRGSALARAQAEQVIALLRASELGLEPELAIVRVSGDEPPTDATRLDDASPSPDVQLPHDAAPDKSRWVDAIERALREGEIDLAVHSAKDVPGEPADGLDLVGAPARAPAEDVLCGARDLRSLAAGARVGTSSVRRAAQLRVARDDLEIVALSGNVDTRLRRLSVTGRDGDGEDVLDAIVLARAGLQRLGREDAIGASLDPATFVPAPGQGVLALQARGEDERARAAAHAITDADAFACLLAERALVRALGASCHTPLGAHARPAGCGCLHMRAWVGLPDGSAWVADELLGGFYDPAELGRDVARRMDASGAGELLARVA
ncbi:MAG TPA: hydroxymethylbilane synthase [Solirubrobacteraceae bacterium]|nr:hydroxymethylbilane synthase [Solirubrobacteraceae bacterium]